MDLFHIWSGNFSSCCFCCGSWGKCLHTSLLKEGSLFPKVLWFSWTYSLWFAKPKIWGTHLFRVSDGEDSSFAPWKSSIFWDPSWLYVATSRMGFWVRACLCLSYPSWCGPFILYCGSSAHVVFRAFSEEIISYEL